MATTIFTGKLKSSPSTLATLIVLINGSSASFAGTKLRLQARPEFAALLLLPLRCSGRSQISLQPDETIHTAAFPHTDFHCFRTYIEPGDGIHRIRDCLNVADHAAISASAATWMQATLLFSASRSPGHIPNKIKGNKAVGATLKAPLCRVFSRNPR